MDNLNSKDVLTNQVDYDNKLPSGLNVLTILTIIWAVFSLGSSVWGFFSAEKSYKEKDKTIEMLNSGKMPSAMKSFMPSAENFDAMVTKSYENRIPLLIFGLVATGLCFWGALEMRKRKKQGFLFYVIGSILPFISTALLIGFFSITGAGSIFFIVLTLMFIGLYAMQRKYLV